MASNSPQPTAPHALILAAGAGRRLGGLDGERPPKALLRFDGRSLLARHIHFLRRAGVQSISVVAGYREDCIRAEIATQGGDPPISVLVNRDYREGSVVSLWAGREVLRAGAPVILMDADVLYGESLMMRLFGSAEANCFLLDRNIEPGDEPVKLCISNGRIVDFHKRPTVTHYWHGESVGFFRFSPGVASELADRVEAYISSDRRDQEYEEPLRDMILAGDPARFGFEDITGLPWTEIDFPEDVQKATALLPALMDGHLPVIGASDVAQRGPTADELAAMKRDGFLAVRGFFTASETATLLRWTEDLIGFPEAPGRHWVYHEDSLIEAGKRVVQRIENFCPFHVGFDELIRFGGLARWTAALIGGPTILFKEKINFKMPGADGFKAHQDQQAGWNRYAPLFISAMVTMDAATVENGCLEIAGARHREGLIGEEWKPLDEVDVALVPLPTAPGDVVFFDSFVPHASKPNLTASPRRVLYLTYNLYEHGDHRERYYADKLASFPPDIERDGSKTYVFRV